MLSTKDAADEQALSRSGLTADHWKVIDLMLPGSGGIPPARHVAAYVGVLNTALSMCTQAQRDSVAEVVEYAGSTGQLSFSDLVAWNAPAAEQANYVFTSAYYMCAEVREALGFPGQVRAPIKEAGPDQQVDDDLLEPVRARGPIYLETPQVNARTT